MSQPHIDEYFFAYSVAPELIDQLLAQGWRHFGVYFYRYNQDNYGGVRRRVRPVRVKLREFQRSKKQRRVWRQNQDLRWLIRPAVIDDAKQELFERHKRRFTHNIPNSLYDFVSERPATVPLECRECCVYDGDELLAASFFDVGAESISAIYAMFAPEAAERSLGLYTMLREIEFGKNTGKRFYYHGYAHETPSFYDYKKRFNALQYFDWTGGVWLDWRQEQ
jgi:arginine-tRNA-protein transferase